MTRWWVLKATVSLTVGVLTPTALIATSPTAVKQVEVDSTPALMKATAKAQPGTRIVLRPGRYEGNCRISGLKGAAAAMIEIASANPSAPAIFQGGEVGIQLIDCAYVQLSDIVVRGASVNNIQVGDASHHIILKHMTSKDISTPGNSDGIKLPGLNDFLFYGCTVSNWGGEGSAIDMVGCSRGLLYRSTFTYSNLKGQTANAVQAKGGTHHLGVYLCTFSDASHRAIQFGGSTGKQYFFQGNYDSGYEGLDMVALGNTITGGGCAVAFVSCTRCIADCNLILNPQEYVVRILHEGAQHGAANNSFSHNLITYGALKDILNQGGPADLGSFTFAGNCWANTTDPTRSIPTLPIKQVLPMSANQAESAGIRQQVIRQAGEEWARHVDKFSWAWQQAQRLDREMPGEQVRRPAPAGMEK